YLATIWSRGYSEPTHNLTRRPSVPGGAERRGSATGRHAAVERTAERYSTPPRKDGRNVHTVLPDGRSAGARGHRGTEPRRVHQRQQVWRREREREGHDHRRLSTAEDGQRREVPGALERRHRRVPEGPPQRHD